MKLLERDEDKADWQDKDPNIELVKNWVKEGSQPTGTEMNYRSPDIQAYRKVLSALKLKQIEGITKTIQVKQGLVDNAMDKYCLPKKVTSQVIQDVHLKHMHIGINRDGNWARTLFFFCKNKVYKNAEPQIWSNVKNILDAQISKFFNCS